MKEQFKLSELISTLKFKRSKSDLLIKLEKEATDEHYKNNFKAQSKKLEREITIVKGYCADLLKEIDTNIKLM